MKENYKAVFTIRKDGKREKKIIIFENTTIEEVFDFLKAIKDTQEEFIIIKIE